MSKSNEPQPLSLADLELEALVCDYFCRQHLAASEIDDVLSEKHGIKLSRGRVWRILERAARRGRLAYLSESAPNLEKQVLEKYPGSRLNRLRVVASNLRADVAGSTARMLMRMSREIYREKEELHIGFAGGSLLRSVAHELARLLEEPPPDFPKELVFHAMVAGWNTADPSNDPNAFFDYFWPFSRPGVQKKQRIRFVALHGPGIVRTTEYDLARQLLGVEDALKAVKDIDVIVTSGGRWGCGHSALHCLYEEHSPATLERLKSAEIGGIGDLNWCALSHTGPINLVHAAAPVRPLVLLEIGEFEQFIASGKHVLVALGPCSECGKPKDDILKTILTLGPKQRLATHVICNSEAAARVLN